MNPNMRNKRGNFGGFGGNNYRGNNFGNEDFDPDFGPGPDYEEEMDEYNDEEFDNNFGWQNNGGGGGPGGFPRGGWGNFNQGPGNWGPPPPNFDMGPPLGWGRGFGPDGPPFQRPQRYSRPVAYLMRCGVDRERVMSIPRNVLRLIRPDYCGICDVEFDSFYMSRNHYTTKGHFKRQNKWIAENRPMGARPKNEIPLKSRDLYCELCDVQITSKVHATSHYDGKPHRAIVEGRKKAKNTALLTRSMAGRLDQLIRREKKFIKSSTEPEKTQEEVEQAAKVFQPELYCEICKTSVTCTEQMTMHLNGKRHLAKEKQHILKMMKGGADKKDKEGDGTIEIDDEEGEGAEADEKTADDADGEGKAGGEGDKYDWGHGGGAWEEEEKQAQDAQ